MNSKWLTIKRSLILLALGGSAFGLFGTSFGAGGCSYANYADYATLYTASGQAVIQTVSDNVFGGFGKDYNTVVRTPTTNFAKAVWANWVSDRVPDDLPNNPIVKR